MTHAISFEDVQRGVLEFGDCATLITVNDNHTPHVVTSRIDIGDERLFAEVGPRSRENLTERRALTLLWQPPAAGDYQMILDGTVESISDADDRGVSGIS